MKNKNYSFLKAIISIIFSALLTATLLVTFSPGSEYIDQIVPTIETENNEIPGQNNQQKIIGILPGHYGFDNGYQCGGDLNFVKEADVNLRIAVMVRDYLEMHGYTVNFMHEFDPKLTNYTALALVSIHTNNCNTGNNTQSGFQITTGGQNAYPSESKRLNDCLTYHYEQSSGLNFLGENYTPEEEMLYSFDTVNNYTTISVIHTGYLGNDYRTISEKTNSLAKGIADGIICYVENETVGSIYKAQPVNTLSTIASSSQKIYKIPLSAAIAAEE